MAWLLKAEPLFGTDPPDEGAARLANYKARHEALQRQVAPELYQVYRHGQALRGSLESTLLACLHFAKSAPVHKERAAPTSDSSIAQASSSTTHDSEAHAGPSREGHFAAGGSGNSIGTFAPPRLLLTFIDENLVQPTSVWLLALESCTERLTGLQRRNHQYHAARTALSRNRLYRPNQPPLRADRQKAVLVAQYEAEERLLEQHLMWLTQQANHLKTHLARCIQDLAAHSVPYSVHAAAGLLQFPLQLLDTPRVSTAAQEEVLNSFLPRSPIYQQTPQQVHSESTTAFATAPVAANVDATETAPAAAGAVPVPAIGMGTGAGAGGVQQGRQRLSGLPTATLPAAAATVTAAAPAGPVEEVEPHHAEAPSHGSSGLQGSAEAGKMGATGEPKPIATVGPAPFSPGPLAPTTPPAADVRTPSGHKLLSQSSLQLARPASDASSSTAAHAEGEHAAGGKGETKLAAGRVSRTMLLLVDSPSTIDATIQAAAAPAQAFAGLVEGPKGYDSDSGVVALAAQQAEQYSDSGVVTLAYRQTEQCSEAGAGILQTEQYSVGMSAELQCLPAAVAAPTIVEGQQSMAAALRIAQQVVLAANAAAAAGAGMNPEPLLTDATGVQSWAGRCTDGAAWAPAVQALSASLQQSGMAVAQAQQEVDSTGLPRGAEAVLFQHLGPAEARLAIMEHQADQQAAAMGVDTVELGTLQGIAGPTVDSEQQQSGMVQLTVMTGAEAENLQRSLHADISPHPAAAEACTAAGRHREDLTHYHPGQGFGSVTPGGALADTAMSEEEREGPSGMPHASWPCLRSSSSSSGSSELPAALEAGADMFISNQLPASGIGTDVAAAAAAAAIPGQGVTPNASVGGSDTGSGMAPARSCPALFSLPQPMPSTGTATPLPTTLSTSESTTLPGMTMEQVMAAACPSAPAELQGLLSGTAPSDTTPVAAFVSGSETGQQPVVSTAGVSRQMTASSSRSSGLQGLQRRATLHLDAEPDAPPPDTETQPMEPLFLPQALPIPIPPTHGRHTAFEQVTLPFTISPSDVAAVFPQSPRAHTPLPAHRMELEPQASLTRLGSSHAHRRHTTHMVHKHSAELGGMSPRASLSTATSALEDVQEALQAADMEKSNSISVALLQEKLQLSVGDEHVGGIVQDRRAASAQEPPVNSPVPHLKGSPSVLGDEATAHSQVASRPDAAAGVLQAAHTPATVTSTAPQTSGQQVMPGAKQAAGDEPVQPRGSSVTARRGLIPGVRPMTSAAAELTAMVSALLSVAAGRTGTAAQAGIASPSTVTSSQPARPGAPTPSAGINRNQPVVMGGPGSTHPSPSPTPSVSRSESSHPQQLPAARPQYAHRQQQLRGRQQQEEEDNPLAGVFSGLLAAVSAPAEHAVGRQDEAAEPAPAGKDEAGDVEGVLLREQDHQLRDRQLRDRQLHGGQLHGGQLQGHQLQHGQLQGMEESHLMRQADGQEDRAASDDARHVRDASHIPQHFTFPVHDGLHASLMADTPDFVFPATMRDIDMSTRMAPYAAQPAAFSPGPNSLDTDARVYPYTAHPAADSLADDPSLGLPASLYTPHPAARQVNNHVDDNLTGVAVSTPWQFNTGVSDGTAGKGVTSHQVSVESSDSSSEHSKLVTQHARAPSPGGGLSRFGTEAGQTRSPSAIGTPTWHAQLPSRHRPHGARMQRNASYLSLKSDQGSVGSGAGMGVHLNQNKAACRKKKRAHRVYLFKTYRRVMM